LGQHAELVPDLQMLAGEHPHHEPTHRQLMLALYRTGRQSEALAAYQRLRRTLDEDLGLAPGQPLRDLEVTILRQDPDLDSPAGTPQAAAEPSPAVTVNPPAKLDLAVSAVPRQLPPPPRQFCGRAADLHRLGEPATRGAGTIWAIDGAGGAGKTWLALHWAHRHAAAFPDGQLYIDLQGFGPTATALEPAKAVRWFLDALGVAPEQIPTSPESQTLLYRSLIADRRMVVVLDNARDAAQVRPLLPGSPTCVVVVTSRNRLTGLVAADGAQPVSLDRLGIADARDLLAVRLGQHRLAADPAAADDIIEQCGRLPLALAIVAAQAAVRPDLALADLAAKLRATGTDLDEFVTDDYSTDLRTVFSWSYRALDADAARMFRLLGLFAGPDISAAAAASLAAVPPRVARGLLGQLTRHHLLTQPVADRYTFHDLLRAYASEQAHSLDDEPSRHAAARRLLDHYLHTAHHAAALLGAPPRAMPPTTSVPGVRPEPLTDLVAARDWFERETPTLGRLLDFAGRHRLEVHTWQLAWTFTTYLCYTALWPHRQLETHHAALLTATRLPDRVGLASTLRSLGRLCLPPGQLPDAAEYFAQAAEIFADLGDPVGEAWAEIGLTLIAEAAEQPVDMVTHAQRALGRYRAAGDDLVAAGLNALGRSHLRLTEYETALDLSAQALDLAQRTGDRHDQAAALSNLGCAHTGLGHDDPAVVGCYHRAIDLFAQVQDQHLTALTEIHLGDHHQYAGRLDIARAHWRNALQILDDITHPDAVSVRQRLDEPHRQHRHR
jgi:tetratricopeptide (TPR) repeat protein